jgi:hypothetical protein
MSTDIYNKSTDKHQYLSPQSCPAHWPSKTFFWNCKVAILVRHFIQLDIDKVSRWDENCVIQQSV